MKKIALGMALLASAGLAHAQGANDNIYIGGGVSSNELPTFSDNATGFQIFAGYELDMINTGAVKSAVEVGYMDSGEWKEEQQFCFFLIGCSTYEYKAEAKGLWANYVASYDFNPSLSAIGRIGLDFGDDNGLMYGVGLGFSFTPQLELRGEYVMRDITDSLQANLVYRMK